LGACNSHSNKSVDDQKGLAKELVPENSIVYQPVLVSDALSEKVNEQSGIVWYQNLFWINNDSDCDASLLAYNCKGVVEKEVAITNAKNIDWEELADDSDYIYIGDFGNNFGNRKDLRVLRLSRKKLEECKSSQTEIEAIGIEWADQSDFSRRKHKHNFDCEAFFAYGDSLFFFTKNWANLKTKIYSSPKSLGNYSLRPKAEFDVNFLVTGADISSDGKLVALIGYKDFCTYLMLFFNFEGTHFFRGKSLRIDLSPLGSAQTEGIVFGQNDSLYISTEETKIPQALYKVEWEQWSEKLK